MMDKLLDHWEEHLDLMFLGQIHVGWEAIHKYGGGTIIRNHHLVHRDAVIQQELQSYNNMAMKITLEPNT